MYVRCTLSNEIDRRYTAAVHRQEESSSYGECDILQRRVCWSRSAESSHVGKLRGVGVEGTTTMSSSDVVIIEVK